MVDAGSEPTYKEKIRVHPPLAFSARQTRLQI